MSFVIGNESTLIAAMLAVVALGVSVVLAGKRREPARVPVRRQPDRRGRR